MPAPVLQVTVLPPCQCVTPSRILFTEQGQSAINNLPKTSATPLTVDWFLSAVFGAGKRYDDAFIPERVTVDTITPFLKSDAQRSTPFVTAEGEAYPLFSLPIPSLNASDDIIPYPQALDVYKTIGDLGEMCCDCGNECVDPSSDRSGNYIVNSDGDGGDASSGRKGMLSFNSAVCGEPAAPQSTQPNLLLWMGKWLLGMDDDDAYPDEDLGQKPPAKQSVVARHKMATPTPSASANVSSTAPQKCGCRPDPIVTSGEFVEGKCGNRRLPSAFGTAPNSLMQTLIPPHATVALGPILYKPTVCTRRLLLLLCRLSVDVALFLSLWFCILCMAPRFASYMTVGLTSCCAAVNGHALCVLDPCSPKAVKTPFSSFATT